MCTFSFKFPLSARYTRYFTSVLIQSLYDASRADPTLSSPSIFILHSKSSQRVLGAASELWSKMASTIYPSDHLSVIEQQSSKSTVPRRNLYFSFARVVISINSMFPLLGGLLQLWLGAESFSILGAILSHECTTDPAFNGQWRFAATIWLFHAPLMLLVASDLRRYAPIAHLVSAGVFAGGGAALWTADKLGIPGTPMGYFVAYISIFLELTVPPLVSLLLVLGARLDRKRT